MEAGRFDRMATVLARATTSSRRTMVTASMGCVLGLLSGDGTVAGKRKRKRKNKRKKKRDKCKKHQTRCRKHCVNTNTDRQHCGQCGNRCASGEQCLNGACFSDDTCPFAQEACPNFRACGAEESDCYCGTTTGGESVCFQDENFCESPRPCQSNQDCAGGRVCVDTSLCCAAYDQPDQPRSCLLPCQTLSAAGALTGENVRQPRNMSGDTRPGRARH